MGGPIIIHPLFTHTVHTVPEPLTFWEAVPDHLLHKIASSLKDGMALARLRRVSKRCRLIADSEDIWRDLCVMRFNVAPDSQPPSSWQEVYRFNHTMLYTLFIQQTADACMVRLQRAAGVPIRLPGLPGYALA